MTMSLLLIIVYITLEFATMKNHICLLTNAVYSNQSVKKIFPAHPNLKDSRECGCDIFIPLGPIIRGLRPGYCTDRAIHLDTSFNISEIVFN
jgi:hypothetical protein